MNDLDLTHGVYIEYSGPSTAPRARTIFINQKTPQRTREKVREEVSYACKVDGNLTGYEVLRAISNTLLREYEEVGLTDPPSDMEVFMCRAALDWFQLPRIQITIDGIAENANYKSLRKQEFLALTECALATNPSFKCFGLQSY